MFSQFFLSPIATKGASLMRRNFDPPGSPPGSQTELGVCEKFEKA